MNNYDRAFVLFDNETVQNGCYCRPLNLIFDGQSDHLPTVNVYGGGVINNTKWLPVTKVFGAMWMGKKVSELNSLICPYEFLSCMPPESHCHKG